MQSIEPVSTPGAHTRAEVQSQPSAWRRAAALAADVRGLPTPGQRVAVVGCGTSWFVAQSYAAAREAAGHGVTDAYTASEARLARGYDLVLAISRSGTTTEISEVLASCTTPSTLLTAVAGGPAAAHADHEIVLAFADEQSVVQTRFATSVLALLRTAQGEDMTLAVADAERALQAELDPAWVAADQITFLGSGWTVGIAHEAALKLRESSQSWTESYPAMEYRHGPVAIAQPGRVVWVFGPVPAGLADDVADTGATLVTSAWDPLAHLVQVHLLAVARAEARNLDADAPRSLTRAVVLDGTRA